MLKLASGRLSDHELEEVVDEELKVGTGEEMRHH